LATTSDGEPDLFQGGTDESRSLCELEDDLLHQIEILKCRVQRSACGFQGFTQLAYWQIGASSLISAFADAADPEVIPK